MVGIGKESSKQKPLLGYYYLDVSASEKTCGNMSQPLHLQIKLIPPLTIMFRDDV